MSWLSKIFGTKEINKNVQEELDYTNSPQIALSIKKYLQSKGLTRTSEEEDLYDKSQKRGDYFEQIYRGEKFENIPLCWKENSHWYMLSGFFIEDDILFAEIYDLQTGPPDAGHCDASGIPSHVLRKALDLIISQYS